VRGAGSGVVRCCMTDAVQWREIRRHPALSEEILGRVDAFRDIAVMGGAHHERLDGKGYPRGITGDAISADTRILTVADVFDALTAERPYRAAMPLAEALTIMERDRGTAFDPACLDALQAAAEAPMPAAETA
jgi:HD-GYP domain-containing protein (c-di-GMP phosphodiesterase class II)